MKSYIVAVLAVALIGAIVMVESGGGGGGDRKGKGKHGGKWGGMMANMTCQGESFNKEAMTKGKECWKEMMGAGDEKSGGDEKKDGEGGKGKGKGKGKGHRKGGWGKKMCVEVCKWKKQGILNADGDYDSAGAAEYVKSLLTSEKTVTAVTAALNNCASKISEDKAKRTDKTCSGYEEFSECRMDDVIGKACGNDEMVKKMKERKEKWKKNRENKGKKDKKGSDENGDSDSQ